MLAGDSTVAKCPIYEYPMAGWGQFLPEILTTEECILNFAKGGSTTQSFKKEGLWDKLLSNIDKDDYILIQFGHNDQKPVKKIFSYGYKNNIENMVKDVKYCKGIPVLLTSPERNNFFNGILYPTLEKEAAIIRYIAEKENILMIDLQYITKKLYTENGEKENRKYFMCLEPHQYKNYPNGFQDNTHFSEEGAKKIAEIVAKELKKIGCGR